MNTTGLLLLGAGGYLAITAFNKVQAAKQISYRNPKVAHVSIGVQNITIQMSVDVVNPTTSDLPFDYFAGSISYKGSVLADFNFTGYGKDIYIKQRTTTTIPFQLTIPTVKLGVNLVNTIKNILNGNTVDTVFTVHSTITVSGTSFPLDFSYDVKNSIGIGTIGALPGFALKWINKHRHVHNVAWWIRWRKKMQDPIFRARWIAHLHRQHLAA